MNTHHPPGYRLAQAADVEAIRTIVGAVDLFPPEMLDDLIAPFLSGESPDIWYVAALEGVVLAFGYCEPERMTEGTFNLLALGTSPDAQGTGVGSGMLRWLEDRLRANGERILIIETMGTPEFEATRRFYLRNDYIEEARIRDFYEAGGDKVVYWKSLQAGE